MAKQARIRALALAAFLAAGPLWGTPDQLSVVKTSCLACHSFMPASGGLSFLEINGTPASAPFGVTVKAGSSFNLSYRSTGLYSTTLNKNTGGSVSVPNPAQWSASLGPVWNDNGQSGATPWRLAGNGLFYYTNYPPSESTTGVAGITVNNGQGSNPPDKNLIASNEVMSLTVNVGAAVASAPYRITVSAMGHSVFQAVAWSAPFYVIVLPPDTPTPSATRSATPSPSVTPSISPTPSSTATATETSTATPCVTPSISPSFTATHTPVGTFTATPSFSDSPTESPTFSSSPSFTDSPTETATATSSVTPSESPSFSATRSVTPSATPSISPTASPTATASATLTATGTLTLTATISPTHSVSPTTSPTWSPSPTLTLEPAFAFASPIGLGVVPNPVQGPSFQLAYQLLGDADQVRVRIYSAAMARVLDLDLGRRQRGPQLETVNLPPGLALGAYFLRLDVREGRQEQASKIVRFFRLNP